MLIADNACAHVAVCVPKEDALIPVAQELCRCLTAATGATFPLAAGDEPVSGARILLRVRPEILQACRAAGPQPREAVAWRCDGRECLEIAGSSGEALWLAMYAFLEEHVGCRWFFPAELGEDIPRTPALEVPEMNVLRTPSFLARDWRFWPVEFQRRKLGGRFQLGGAHSYSGVVPAEVLREHPEYGVMLRGERHPEAGNQRCLSQPGVEDLAVRYCLEKIARDPDAATVDLSPNDCDVFCDCPGCLEANLGRPPREKETPLDLHWVSRGVFEFSGRVAERVAREHPDKLIVVIAYGRTKKPPRDLRVHDNVLVWYCDEPNVNWQGSAGRQKMEREISEWARIAKHVGVYDYVVNQAWPGLPRPITGILAQELKHLHAQGGRYYYTQHAEDFGVNLPNYYLVASLLWDVTRNPQQVLDDLYQRCFRAAAPAVQEYFEILERAVMRVASQEPGPGVLGVTGHRRSHEAVCAIYTPQVLADAEAALARARRLAGDAVSRGRLKIIEDSFTLLKAAVGAARKTFDFEMEYRIPTLAPWAWNVGNYDYHSAVEKLEMFGDRCIDSFQDMMLAWRQYRAIRSPLEETLAVSQKFSRGASFDALPVCENIWKLFTGEIESIPLRVQAKSLRVM